MKVFKKISSWISAFLKASAEARFRRDVILMEMKVMESMVNSYAKSGVPHRLVDLGIMKERQKETIEVLILYRHEGLLTDYHAERLSKELIVLAEINMDESILDKF